MEIQIIENEISNKQKANELFLKGKFKEALLFYTNAIQNDPNNKIHYSNRSICFLKLESYSLALKDAKKCIELDSSFIISFYE